MFANGPGDRGLILGQVIPKTQKMVLDSALLNAQHYKVNVKGKVEQFREWSSTFPYIAIEKGTFGSPSTKVANLYYQREFELKYYESGNGLVFDLASAWKYSVNAISGDVEMFPGPLAIKSLHKIKKIPPKMMSATFNGNHYTTIISC